MDEKPNTASHVRVCSMSRNTAIHVLTKPSSVKVNPKRAFIWVVAIVKAAALVNPAMTGAAIKSIKKPKRCCIKNC